jgi:two-component system, response regulator PdtaR
MKSIFIVEDEVIISIFIKMYLEKKGFNVIGTCTNGTEAVDIILDKKPDIIILDVSLKGGLNGIEVAYKIYERYQPKIIFVTGLEERALRDVKIKYSYLRKPFDNKHLLEVLNNQ